MIVKDLLSTNGYTFQDPVTAQEMQDLLKPILPSFKAIILNKNTASKYKITPGGKFVTINNNVPDGMFFINSIR